MDTLEILDNATNETYMWHVGYVLNSNWSDAEKIRNIKIIFKKFLDNNYPIITWYDQSGNGNHLMQVEDTKE